jgi:hypothetical protein
MKRLRIKEEIQIASKTIGRYGGTEMYTWADIKKAIEEKGEILNDSDILVCEYKEGYEYDSSSNETSWTEDCYNISIIRYRDETDEEMEDRTRRKENTDKLLKRNRYKDYLRLKQEFEPES